MNIKADILVVSPEINELRLLSNFLSQQDYYVRQSLDGEMTLIAIETQIPDLVFLSFDLPDMKGYELGNIIKNKPKDLQIPLIYLDNFFDIEHQKQAFENGAVDYFSSPYSLEHILEKIKYYLQVSLEKKILKEELQQLRKQLNILQSVQDIDNNNSCQELNLLNMAIAATHNGIVITDARLPDNPIVYANLGFEKMTGYQVEEIIGKNLRFLQGDDKEQPGLNIIRQALKNERECNATLRNYRKDGSLFWNEISISPVRNQEGIVTHYIGVQTDITEKKKTEEDHQRYQSSVKQMNRELYRLNNELHRLVNIDGLTGVANRRCFDEHFEQEWRRCQRENLHLSIILGDIDYFKLYNDTYGHLQGDDCLKAVAQMLERCVHRAGDLVARTGGEEFTIILPNTSLKGAMKVSQMIQKNLQQLKIPHKSSSVNEYVTMSLGVASIIPSPNYLPKKFIETADKGLYLAKEAGRNRAIPYIYI